MHSSKLTSTASLLTTKNECECVCVSGAICTAWPSPRRLNPFLSHTLSEMEVKCCNSKTSANAPQTHTHTHSLFLSGVADQYTSSCSAYSPVISTCWYLIWGTHTEYWLIGLNVPFSACSQNGVKQLHRGLQLHTFFFKAALLYLFLIQILSIPLVGSTTVLLPRKIMFLRL